MLVDLQYGRQGLRLSLPDHCVVLKPRKAAPVPDERAAIRHALRSPTDSLPLARLAGKGMRVVVTHSDITRATPNDRLLPVILAELETCGVHREDITLLNALGTHRPQTAHELGRMLGKQVFDNYRCIQHNAFDDQALVAVGKTSFGNDIRLNRTLLEADLKIFTGFIEPHFFAGFSGGPKAVLPALAGAESVFSNHSYAMIGHPGATFGLNSGNPIWEEMAEAAQKVPNTFLVNVTLDSEHRITGVYAGEVIAAHAAGCQAVRDASHVKIDAPFDIAITTNSGYPLDQNLYQCVKGLAAARRAVRKGGTILLLAGCEDGLPANSAYIDLLRRAGSPQELLRMVAQPGFR